MVADDKYAIGYSGIGYLKDGVRTVPLAAVSGDKCYDTSPARPTRAIILCHAICAFISQKRRASHLIPRCLEFIKYVVSRDGQTDTVNSGFYPITEAIRAKALMTLGISNASN